MSELENENKLKKLLEDRFGADIGAVTVQRARRVWIETAPGHLVQVLECLKTCGYNYLSTITGFDEGVNLGACYHATDTHIIATVKARAPLSSPVLPTVTGLFPGAVSYERELEDMFGIKVEGLPPGRRYPLPDDFPAEHPLRKTWKTAEFQARAKSPAPSEKKEAN